MSAEITIEFYEGKAKVSVNGVQGKACTDITAKLEEALGKVEKRELTEEYKEKEVKQVNRVNQ